MKLTIATGSVEVSEDFKEIQFGIRSTDMGIILEILRSKMYKNPIAAICREISSNARDANKEVNNKKPVQISINEENIFDRINEDFISFKDEGPGISPERMSDVFVNYGASTKREDNKQLGGFGLGAKTPFAYADNFAIITIVNKTKYHYIAAIEENNTGKIYLIETSETSEPNGTTIKIPIQKNDINKFKTELIKATYFWPIKPIFNFEKDEDLNITEHSHGILLGSNNLFLNNLYVLIDGIPYEINSEKITPIDFSSYTILLTFKTGTLSISANRESIRYDNDTITKIQTKYEHFIHDLKESAQTEINNCKNYFDAALKLKHFVKNNNIIKVLYDNNISLIFDNINVDYKLNLDDNLRLIHAKFDKFSKTCHTRIVTELESEMSLIYYLDLKKTTLGRNLTIFNSQDNLYYLENRNDLLKSFSNQSFSVKKGLAKNMRIIVNKFKWFKSIGLNTTLYSKVKITKTYKDKQKNIMCVKVLKKESFRGSIRPLCNKKIDINTIDANNHCFHIHNDRKSYLLPIHISWAEFLNTYGITVLFISTKKSEQLTHLKSMTDTINNLDINKVITYSNGFVAKKFITNRPSILHFKFNNNIYDKIIFLNKIAKSIETLPEDFLTKFPPSQEVMTAIDTIENVYKKYPLLINYSRYDKDKLHFYNDYITLIDAREEYERNKVAQDAGIHDICI
jgi:hypothetical protein